MSNEIKYKVLADHGDLKEGEVVTVSLDNAEQVEVFNALLLDGVVEVTEESAANLNAGVDAENLAKGAELSEEEKAAALAAATGADEEVVAKEPVKTFEGKVIISEGYREVDEKQVRYIRLDDGSIQDISDEDYSTKVVTSA